MKLPTTPGSLLLHGEPKLHPEDGSRYMAEVWQLQDDGLWQELTDNGKRGARMGPHFFATDTRVLYEAPADPKPFKELKELGVKIAKAQEDLVRRDRELDEMWRQHRRLQQACAEETS